MKGGVYQHKLSAIDQFVQWWQIELKEGSNKCFHLKLCLTLQWWGVPAVSLIILNKMCALRHNELGNYLLFPNCYNKYLRTSTRDEPHRIKQTKNKTNDKIRFSDKIDQSNTKCRFFRLTFGKSFAVFKNTCLVGTRNMSGGKLHDIVLSYWFAAEHSTI